MTDLPKVAGRGSAKVTLSPGKNYAYCTCGLSSSQPFCDGTHKGTGYAPHIFTVDEEVVWGLCQCKQTCSAPRCDGSHKQLPPETV